MTISRDQSLDATTYQSNWYKEGDRFNKFHHQVPAQETKTPAMNKVISFPISKAILLCTMMNGDKLYWTHEGISNRLHTKECSCKFCKIVDTSLIIKDNCKCHKCHTRGHLQANCPNKPSKGKKPEKRTRPIHIERNWGNRTITPTHTKARWGIDNPDWEAQELDPNWTRPTGSLKHPEPKLSDYSKHLQECFKKSGCEHQRFYSYQDECMSCRIRFDTEGNYIRQKTNSPTSPAISQFTSVELEDIRDRSQTPEVSISTLNDQADHAINCINRTDSLVSMVFPDLPLHPKENYDKAKHRRDLLRDVATLAEATFPANFQTTYIEAWRTYKDILGWCHHNLVYRLHHEHCEECRDYANLLEG
jgi:hypothetical protein